MRGQGSETGTAVNERAATREKPRPDRSDRVPQIAQIAQIAQKLRADRPDRSDRVPQIAQIAQKLRADRPDHTCEPSSTTRFMFMNSHPDAKSRSDSRPQPLLIHSRVCLWHSRATDLMAPSVTCGNQCNPCNQCDRPPPQSIVSQPRNQWPTYQKSSIAPLRTDAPALGARSTRMSREPVPAITCHETQSEAIRSHAATDENVEKARPRNHLPSDAIRSHRKPRSNRRECRARPITSNLNQCQATPLHGTATGEQVAISQRSPSPATSRRARPAPPPRRSQS